MKYVEVRVLLEFNEEIKDIIYDDVVEALHNFKVGFDEITKITKINWEAK